MIITDLQIDIMLLRVNHATELDDALCKCRGDRHDRNGIRRVFQIQQREKLHTLFALHGQTYRQQVIPL